LDVIRTVSFDVLRYLFLCICKFDDSSMTFDNFKKLFKISNIFGEWNGTNAKILFLEQVGCIFKVSYLN
jgi:hypothetical protein